MRKRKIFISIACVIGSIVLLFLGYILYKNYKDKHELDDLTADNLLELRLRSSNVDNSDDDIIIEIDFEKRIMIAGTRKEIRGDNSSAREVVLTKEQCQDLKEYIVEYSHKVKAKENEYWPQSYEYPPMFIKFYYNIKYGNGENYKEYIANGALCYPDGWDEFVNTLLEY